MGSYPNTLKFKIIVEMGVIENFGTFCFYSDYPPFNAATGSGSATTYAGQGINPYVYGEGGGYGDQGGYTGPTGETIVNYTYGENDAGPHAVTSRSNGDSFSYDENGNMTIRTMDGVTWTHTFDAENRLVEVDNGITETTYIYDSDGTRVKRIVDDGTTITITVYVAGMEIELEDNTETQRTIYYSEGGAFRIIGGEDEGLYFKHADHLGSTSVLSDSNGQKVENSDVLYAPFGEVRSGELSALTDFGFTGQRNDSSTGGLIYYGARYYLPELRRFISADTIVPNPVNPQTYNRYAYVLNNPLIFIDPSGHKAVRHWSGYWYDDGTTTADYDASEGHWYDDGDPTTGNSTGIDTIIAPADENNVTNWLIGEINNNSSSEEIADLAILNDPVSIFVKPWAYDMWAALNSPGGSWDWKVTFDEDYGWDAIMLCGSSVCYAVTTDTAGNIHYGYVGMEAGFTPDELHYGAGAVQFVNHLINGVPSDPHCDFDSCPDWTAIELGIQLHENCSTLTVECFQETLDNFDYDLPQLEAENYDEDLVVPNTGNGPYRPPGYFDNEP